MKKTILILLILLIGCRNKDSSIDIYTSYDSTSLNLSMVLGTDQDELIFAGVVDAFLRSESELVVIEGIRQQVTEIDLTSLQSQRIGQQGLGPQEYNTPASGCIMNEGTGIAIADNSKILIYEDTSVTCVIPHDNMFTPLNITQYGETSVLSRIVKLSIDGGYFYGTTTIQLLGNEVAEEVFW